MAVKSTSELFFVSLKIYIYKIFFFFKNFSNPLCVTFQVFISAALMEYFCSKVSHTVWLLVILWLNVN